MICVARFLINKKGLPMSLSLGWDNVRLNSVWWTPSEPSQACSDSSPCGSVNHEANVVGPWAWKSTREDRWQYALQCFPPGVASIQTKEQKRKKVLPSYAWNLEGSLLVDRGPLPPLLTREQPLALWKGVTETQCSLSQGSCIGILGDCWSRLFREPYIFSLTGHHSSDEDEKDQDHFGRVPWWCKFSLYSLW